MKFYTLSLLGISLTLGARAQEDVEHRRNLKQKTRRPRIRKVDIIADLESKLAAATSQISALQDTVSASNLAISSLEANVTASAATIDALKLNITVLSSNVTTCQNQLKSSFTGTQVNSSIYSQLVSEYAFDLFDSVTPASYKTINRLSNLQSAKLYEIAGGLTYDNYNPEPQFFLPNAGDDTLVRDMQVRTKVQGLISEFNLSSYLFFFTGSYFQISCSRESA